MERFVPLLPLYGNLSDALRLNRFVTDLLADYRIRQWNLTISASDFIGRLPESTPRAVIDTLFMVYAEQSGKVQWGDKTPQNAFHLPQILELFPHARIVHLVRDGRDVCESMKRVYIGRKSTVGIAGVWRRYIREMATARDRLIPGGQFLQVRYEDVVLQTESSLKRILHFIGAERKDGSGAPGVDSTMAEFMASVPHLQDIGGDIRMDRIGIHRSRLTPRAVALFESIAGQELESCGYELITDAAARPTRRENLKHMFLDGVYRYVRKALSRSGLVQLKRDLASRWQLWRRQVKLRLLRFVE